MLGGGNQKTGRDRLARLFWVYINIAGWRHPGNYGCDKIPIAFPLATACVRLVTPSFA
jgi:hypothetical protein